MDKLGFYKRGLTALLFAAITLFLVLFNQFTAHLFLFIVALLTLKEYILMRNEAKFNQLIVWTISLAIGPGIMLLNYFSWFTFEPILPLIVLSVIYMIYLAGRLFFKYDYGRSYLTIIASAFLYLGLPLLLTNQYLMGKEGNKILFNILLLIWASDTFAYLVGSLIGKRKLLPAVSPGKTIEGAIGGLVFTLIVAALLHNFFPLGSLLFHLGLGAVVWLFGLMGDLVESHLKRSYQVKDSGSWLPGHGGFLDRFDAFVFMLPFVLLYFLLF
jgi:phosphatidate cytidylyltransferase